MGVMYGREGSRSCCSAMSEMGMSRKGSVLGIGDLMRRARLADEVGLGGRQSGGRRHEYVKERGGRHTYLD